MKKKLVIPKFKNEDEEFAFWSKIDLSDYFDSSDFKHFDLKKFLEEHQRPRTKRITMRLPESLVAKVKQQAEKLDVPYQSLMKIYIQKGASSRQRKFKIKR